MPVNELIHENSPYLLQHAHNPVHWMPWSKKIFELAKQSDQLILVSIGYSACHWCHVMEQESFEDKEVADLMNARFINVKVDREERPDVDMLYMTAVQLMKGQGGWPLNCFILPDGRPVYGGTYFTRSQWINTLHHLSDLFRSDREKVMQYATRLTEGIKQTELINSGSDEHPEMSFSVIEKCISGWKNRFDTINGGPHHAPKFPLPNNYHFLLQYAIRQKDASVMKQVNLTLTKMAYGGIYDQLEGGFARYSTDMVWKVPHFEKMLYDNAQLISLYCDAYRYTNNPLYKETAQQCIGFVFKEWKNNDHGFYSALDADSEGEEGKYYVWEKDELQELLKDHYAVFCAYYSISGNDSDMHGANLLMRNEQLHDLMNTFRLTKAELSEIISSCNDLLIRQREKRIKPSMDNKILASWNGLMCKALCTAYLSFGVPEYKSIAIKNATFIHDNLMGKDFSVFRSAAKGKERIKGFLDDYAFVVDAFLEVYVISQDEKWLKSAEELCHYAIQHFYNPVTGLFFYTANNGEELSVRTTEVSDNVIPSSNSQMARNLFKLSRLSGNEKYFELCLAMTKKFGSAIAQYGEGYSNWASLYLDLLSTGTEICIVGKDVNEKLLELSKHYHSNAIFAVATSASELSLLKNRFVKNKTLIYVCKNKTCKLPTEDSEEALRQLETIS